MFISGQQARALIAQGGQLVDVRNPGEFAMGALPGAINIPLGELARQAHTLDRTRPIVLYCVSGARSGQAQMFLRSQGYDAHNVGFAGNYQS